MVETIIFVYFTVKKNKLELCHLLLVYVSNLDTENVDKY